MYRVTTPTHTFTLPIQTGTCEVILVTYEQDGIKVTKKYANGTLPSGMTLDGKNVVIRLTQEETKLFKSDDFAFAQVRVLTNAGDSFASRQFPLFVEEVQSEEILTDE